MSSRVGIRGVLERQQRRRQFQAAGQELDQASVAMAQENLKEFRCRLKAFALKYGDEINTNAQFRGSFHQMCAALGVDPLISNKSVLNEVLGMGEFYSRLGVQVLTICLSSRAETGGIMEVDECLFRVKKMRGLDDSDDVVKQDIIRAVKQLQCLGTANLAVHTSPKNVDLILCVPEEIDEDHLTAWEVARAKGYFTVRMLMQECGWDEGRSTNVANFLVRESVAWVEEMPLIEKEGGKKSKRILENYYWIASIMLQSQK
eukprot:Lankesteria_metandrocarpae@DN9736_c0_g1_i1.p1